MSRESFKAEEIERILVAAENADPLIFTLVRVCISTGMRKVDCCNLTWESVDQGNNCIHVATAKRGSTVRIPILPPLRREIDKASAAAGDKRSGPVFPALAETYRRYPHRLIRRFYGICRQCGLKEEELHAKGTSRRRAMSLRGIHSLRTTFITMALQAGVAVETIMHITGHRTFDIVRLNYNRPQVGSLRAELQRKMPTLVSGHQSLIAPILEGDVISPQITDVPSRLVAALRIMDQENLVSLQPILMRLCNQLPPPDFFRDAVRSGLELLSVDTMEVIRARLLRFLAEAYHAAVGPT